ncbi:MAG: two-component system alkaline phosphatase synthesis response regulator PhoP [Vicingaceae bacterium]|jgi:two-component system alkaline phosphatase synthesis response regulator PhoP
MQMANILLIDENEHRLSGMSQMLEDNNFTVVRAQNTSLFDQEVFNYHADLVIIAIESSNGNSLDQFQQLKIHKSLEEAFVVMVSQQKQEEIQIMALNSGADDFWVEPIAQRLILKRINALLKRRKLKEFIKKSTFYIDHERFVIVKDGEEIYLPKKEFQLLSLLYSAPERIFTRDEIKRILWENFDHVQMRTIDVHIRKIREKVGDNTIETVQGKGYKLNAA